MTEATDVIWPLSPLSCPRPALRFLQQAQAHFHVSLSLLHFTSLMLAVSLCRTLDAPQRPRLLSKPRARESAPRTERAATYPGEPVCRTKCVGSASSPPPPTRHAESRRGERIGQRDADRPPAAPLLSACPESPRKRSRSLTRRDRVEFEWSRAVRRVEFAGISQYFAESTGLEFRTRRVELAPACRTGLDRNAAAAYISTSACIRGPTCTHELPLLCGGSPFPRRPRIQQGRREGGFGGGGGLVDAEAACGRIAQGCRLSNSRAEADARRRCICGRPSGRAHPVPGDAPDRHALS